MVRAPNTIGAKAANQTGSQTVPRAPPTLDAPKSAESGVCIVTGLQLTNGLNNATGPTILHMALRRRAREF